MSKDDFMGGMFDFNRDDVTDPGEQYLAFRIWEDVNGIEEDDEDTEQEDDQ